MRTIRAPELQPATISDFGGGLNVVDNDTTMKSRYAKILKNWNKNTDGSMSVRWGTQFKFDIGGQVAGDMIELIYFSRHLIAVTSEGEIAKVEYDTGSVTPIWNDAIAGALVGAPDGWTPGLAVGSIDSTEFKGNLIICNGLDKPLIINSDLEVDYLQDPALGTNIFTPIGRYCTTVSNYCVIAGIEAEETDIYVSSQGTSGVWFGDADPNDAVVFSIASYVPQNSGRIIGLGSFRNYLLVAFEGSIVVVELGQYVADAHVPKVQDNIVSHGVVSHRTMISTRQDFVMADVLGWHSAFKNNYGLIDTKPLSELINPSYIAAVPTTDAGRVQSFSVRNGLEGRIMTFLATDTGPVTGYVLTSSDREKIKEPAWNTIEGWAWTCGCSTERGRVFFGVGTKIFLYGNSEYPGEGFTADFVNEYDGDWQSSVGYNVGDRVEYDNVVYIAVEAHISDNFELDLSAGYWQVYAGDEIEFDWELPWTDINARARKKFLQYIQMDTRGAAAFEACVYVDNFYTHPVTGLDSPQLILGFVGGDAPGYGGGDQPFGGGRRTKDERPWMSPGQFKILKLRFRGSSRQALRVQTVTILYHMGTYKR